MLHKEKPLSFEPVMDETHENPLEVPGLRLIFEEGHNDRAGPCFTNFLMVGGGTENDPFSTLPFEILELIIAELTLEDVSLLKQASQVYANLVLPDTFWRSQFRRGSEFEHVFESMEYGSQCKGRWRSIFLGTKELQNNPKLRNRKRVVTLAWDLLDLVERRGQISCSMLDSPPSLLGLLESTAPLDPLKWATASRSLLPPHEHFNHGTRCLYRLTIGVPSDITSVFISTIVRPTLHFRHKALKLVTLSVAGKDEIETDMKTSHNDKPPAPRDTNIWFPEIPDPSLLFLSVPELPRVYRHGQDEMPLSMILFGGLKGELLRHIVKMTVWINDTHPLMCVVWGIGFTFDCLVDGQRSLVLGHSRDDGEYDFPIDGRGGERICRMESITQYSWTCDLGFRVRPNCAWAPVLARMLLSIGLLTRRCFAKIHTTRHRIFELPPPSSGLRLREDPVSKSLSVNDGTIVGFCSRKCTSTEPANNPE
ncbi:hypothetical protein V500_08978 [Pseudogymnoascus sp. VKM F-4518 (FW-2643)]|nr:hypothetical protein V500_08978 [Pseudogymnoascus sp. VKM F-4518 (FW-2643)]